MKILFFAALREHLNCDQFELEIALPSDTNRIRSALQQAFPQQAELLADGKALAAVNQTLIHDNTVVNEGDEVAFFPPVTGG